MSKIKDYFVSFKDGTKRMFKEFLNPKTNKKQRANMWSFSRLISSFINIVPISIGLITGSFIPYICALGIAGYGALTDFFDGKSARKHQSFSEYGKLLDQVSDKLFALINGILISIINPLYLIPLTLECTIGFINYPLVNKYPYFSKNSLQIGRVKEWPLMISLALGFVSTINPITYFISIGLISITVPLQIITAKQYHHRIKIQKQLYNIKSNSIKKTINDDDKIENIELKISNSIKEMNESKHRREMIEGLKKLKKELIIDSPPINKTKIYKK